VRLARSYPACQVVGVDGDQHSIDSAIKRVEEAGVSERVTLVCSPLEAMHLDEVATLVVNNISMHECCDIDRVTANVKAALSPGAGSSSPTSRSRTPTTAYGPSPAG
jgi:ubiquinone/menaquinone biosynthesis C-methylase UbiE